jgi:hypothetical protein
MTISTIHGSQIRLGAITAAHLAASAKYISNAFNYVGTIEGGLTGSGTDLSLQSADGKRPGSYYKVITAGFFKVDAGAQFYANINDGLVWNLSGSVDIIDNTGTLISGDTGLIDVSGTVDDGFTVTVADAFTGRVTTLETNVDTVANLDTDSKNLVGAINELHAAIVPPAPVYVRQQPTTGAINSTNLDYTLEFAPIAGTLLAYLNGILQALTDDYTYAAPNDVPTVSFVEGGAPKTDSVLTFLYFKLG